MPQPGSSVTTIGKSPTKRSSAVIESQSFRNTVSLFPAFQPLVVSVDSFWLRLRSDAFIPGLKPLKSEVFRRSFPPREAEASSGHWLTKDDFVGPMEDHESACGPIQIRHPIDTPTYAL